MGGGSIAINRFIIDTIIVSENQKNINTFLMVICVNFIKNHLIRKYSDKMYKLTYFV